MSQKQRGAIISNLAKTRSKSGYNRKQVDDHEERLSWIIEVLGPASLAGRPDREYRPLPPRRWRLDFAWPSLRVGIELQGGIWSRGASGHKGKGHLRDMEKLNTLQVAGWIILQFPTDRIVQDPTGVAQEIRAALRARMGIQ